MSRNVIVSLFSILHSINNFEWQAFSLYVILFLLSVCFRPTHALAYFWYLFSLRNRVANLCSRKLTPYSWPDRAKVRTILFTCVKVVLVTLCSDWLFRILFKGEGVRGFRGELTMSMNSLWELILACALKDKKISWSKMLSWCKISGVKALGRLPYLCDCAAVSVLSREGYSSKCLKSALNQRVIWAQNAWRFLSNAGSHLPPLKTLFCEETSWKTWGELVSPRGENS